MTDKIELTIEELKTMLQAATGNVKDFVMDSDNFIDGMLQAINFTRCCTELKDKEALTFEEYLVSKGYKLSDTYIWQIDNRDLSKEEVIKQRKQYEYSL